MKQTRRLDLDDELYDPPKHCKRGHLIPRNGDIDPRTGKWNKRPRIACEQCAIDAGGNIEKRPRPLRKGEKIEGQSSFLGDVPAIEVR